MDKKKILMVDGDKHFFSSIKINFEKKDYILSHAASGEEALAKLLRDHFHLILLDLTLPGIDGFELVRRLKFNHKISSLPVIVTSDRNEEIDIVIALELGADDYLIKPVRLNELEARMNAVLRRKTKHVNSDLEIIHTEGMEIIPVKKSLKINGQSVELTFAQYKILFTLAQKPGLIYTRSQIIDLISGDNVHITERSVDVQISSIRKKLGKYGKCIETVRMFGYRFRPIQ